MKSKLTLGQTVALAAVAVCGAGCGGLSLSPSVSPASFFLPGLIQAPVPRAPSDSPLFQQDSIQAHSTSALREFAQAR